VSSTARPRASAVTKSGSSLCHAIVSAKSASGSAGAEETAGVIAAEAAAGVVPAAEAGGATRPRGGVFLAALLI